MRTPKKKVCNFVGGVSSPVLANMALDGLERILRKKYPHSGPKALKGMNKQVNLVRYCDDFLITGLSKEVLEQEVKPLVTDFLRDRETVCPCRSGHFQSLVAMGTAETSEERQAMGEGSLFWASRKPALALLRDGKRQGRKAYPQPPLPGLRHTNNPVHKDEGGL